MKGRIILQDINKPVEGMQVVYQKKEVGWLTTHTPKSNTYYGAADEHGEWLTDGSHKSLEEVIKALELKQIAVEYRKVNSNGLIGLYNIPLHSDDWNMGMALMGHIVEFTQSDDLKRFPVARIVTATPVRTMEDIPEHLRGEYQLCPKCKKGFLTYGTCSNCDYDSIPIIEETWDDIRDKWIDDQQERGSEIISSWKWLKQHYYTPKKK